MLQEDRELKCDFCDKDAVYTDRYRSIILTTEKSQHYCGKCFTTSLEERVLNNMNTYKMIEPGDRVLVCVSGEKDSTVMFHLVKKIVKERIKNVNLIALTVNEGISDYCDRCAANVRKMTEESGIHFVERSYVKEFGKSLDNIYDIRDKQSYRMCLLLFS